MARPKSLSGLSSDQFKIADQNFRDHSKEIDKLWSAMAKLDGRATGQTLNGGTQPGEKLILRSTSNDDKGEVDIGGDAINKSVFEEDGTLRFEGNATVWEDLRVPGLAVRTNASAPDLIAFLAAGGLLIYAFDGGETTEQCYFCIQLPHSYKTGTNIKPHVHWCPTTNDAGTVVWQLEYSWANINGVFPASATITASQAAAGAAWTHQMATFSDITGTGKGISSMLVCRLFRNPGHASDNYTHDAGFLEFDIHYESDTVGSREASSK